MLLLQNKVAIDGVLLAVEAALKSTTASTAAANFNSKLGLKPATIIGLIEGFDASLVRTLYSQDGYELAKTVLMIFSTKKIQALTDSDVTQIKSMQTLLSTVLKIQILAEISTVQTAITDAGSTLEKTEADITKLTFPLSEESEETEESSLTEVERLTIVLQALLANKNGLEVAITAITTALSSSSSTGASGAKVIEFVHSLVALSVSLYGPDLEKTIIQSVALDLVKITIITASAELTATEKVIGDRFTEIIISLLACLLDHTGGRGDGAAGGRGVGDEGDPGHPGQPDPADWRDSQPLHSHSQPDRCQQGSNSGDSLHCHRHSTILHL